MRTWDSILDYGGEEVRMRKIMAFFFICCLLWPAAAREVAAAPRSFTITVAAGPFDRRETVASFLLPKEMKGLSFALRDEANGVIALQVDGARRATFVLPEMKAGTSKRYRLEPLPVRAAGKAVKGVAVTRAGDKLLVTSAGRKVIDYQAQPGQLPSPDIKPILRRGGYIHPVYTPAGRVISDDYAKGHLHHHGIWFAWTKTEFEGRKPDFWNMGDGTGTVEFVAVDATWNGSVHGGFKSRHRYVDLSAPKPVTALHEEWQVTVYRVGLGPRAYSMFDLVATQETASPSPLFLPEHRYGGVGFRGSHEWLDKNNCVFLTSEGKGRLDGHATRARWCHIGGKVGGAMAGITILDHPDNFRAPQPMRIHPDEPFFCYAPSQAGDWEIGRGQQYVSRYRFVVYDGEPDKAELDRLWNDYAKPPQVTIEAR